MKKKLFFIAIGILLIFAAAFCALFFADTGIPRLYLEGDISEMHDKSDKRNIEFEYSSDSLNVSGYAQIKIQGNSSTIFEKKNYTLKFYEDAEHTDKLRLDLGWGGEYEYCMKANWIDRTHSRNIVTARLVSQMQEKYGLFTDAPCNGAIDGFPVEIYINGSFLGLYTFNIPKDAWLFNMDKDKPDHILVCSDSWEDTNLFMARPDFTLWEVEVGEESDATLEKLNRLFDFVINSSDEEFRANFEDYINLDSALNYYVMTDFTYMYDNTGKNMLLATYDGKLWYLALYDMDSSWGTDTEGRGLFPYKEQPLDMARNRLFARMEELFAKELAERYFELREDILSEEHIMAEFNAFRDEIPFPSFFKEFVRWSSGWIRVPSDIPGYEYSQIEEYMDIVADRLDAKYAAMLG